MQVKTYLNVTREALKWTVIHQLKKSLLNLCRMELFNQPLRKAGNIPFACNKSFSFTSIRLYPRIACLSCSTLTLLDNKPIF